MSQAPFQKFVPKKKNSLIKEEFKQAKKKAKKQRAAAIDKRFEEKRQLKAAARNAPVQAPPSKTSHSRKEDKVKAIETNFTHTKKVEDIKKEYAPAPVKTAPRIVRPSAPSTAEMPLNKFVAHCGVCSRRDAVTLIKEGKVKVNNEVVKEPAHKVTEIGRAHL